MRVEVKVEGGKVELSVGGDTKAVVDGQTFLESLMASKWVVGGDREEKWVEMPERDLMALSKRFRP